MPSDKRRQLPYQALGGGLRHPTASRRRPCGFSPQQQKGLGAPRPALPSNLTYEEPWSSLRPGFGSGRSCFSSTRDWSLAPQNAVGNRARSIRRRTLRPVLSERQCRPFDLASHPAAREGDIGSPMHGETFESPALGPCP